MPLEVAASARSNVWKSCVRL